MLRIEPFPHPQSDGHGSEDVSVRIASTLLILMGLLEIGVRCLDVAQRIRGVLLDEDGGVLLFIDFHLKLLQDL